MSLRESVIALSSDGRAKVLTPAHPLPCEWVRVELDGQETLYWDFVEWRDDPRGVMGAIVGAIKAVTAGDFDAFETHAGISKARVE